MNLRPRRFLPSISMLIAFEAVMKAGSVTAAAREIDLTQSTVSRLLKNLEDQLGCALFVRERKRLIPTDAAQAYRAELSRGLDLIQRAGMAMVANPGGGTLSLAVLPTFGTRWLAPRLGDFLSANPGIAVNPSTRVRRFDFASEGFDAAVFFGAPDWPGAQFLRLFAERYTACAAPSLLAASPVRSVGDLEGLPLLQLETRPQAWADWFGAHGAEPPRISGMVLDQFSMMIQAAISGLGIALLPDYLARTEIAEKRLVPLLNEAVPGTGAYWLAWPERHGSARPLAAFRTWLETVRPETG
jgi:DNA-binding transcriptional LysR family regulator